GPVRTPQTTVESPSVKYAGERIPDVRERIRLPGQRAGATHLDHRVLTFGKIQHLGQIRPGLRRGRRGARLQDSEMIDDEARIGVAIDYGGPRVQVAPAQNVDREIVLDGRTSDTVEARVSGVAVASRFFCEHDANPDRARRLLPLSDDI